MKEKFKYTYDNTNNIVFKNYFGKVRVYDIIQSWDFAFTNNLFPSNVKRFILNYRKASIEFNTKSHIDISSYYQERISMFRDSKIAIIVNTPEATAISVLFSTLDDGYQSKPFSTVKAAKSWVLQLH